ncbi:hypothetical protein HK100_009879, partial [Physocladia obscura]
KNKLQKTELDVLELKSNLSDTAHTLEKSTATLDETMLQKNAEIEQKIPKFDAIVAEKMLYWMIRALKYPTWY